MASDRLVVIGGVAAGLSAASRARRVNPRLEIWVYEKGPDISYSACGIPYFIGGNPREADALRVYSPEFFQAKRNIRVFTRHEAVEISPGKRRVTIVAPGREPEEVAYSSLIVATGAEPARPALPGLDLSGVFHVNDLQAAVTLRNFLDAARPRHGVIVGSGYIGLEMAEAMHAAGLTVTLLDRAPLVFESVDEEISSAISAELARQNVPVWQGVEVRALLGDREGRVRRVALEGPGASSIEADCVILATGLRPRVKLAIEAGIEIGATGAIRVNEYQETNLAGIFAAGDCAEAHHRVSGRAAYIPLGTTANKQGRVAGENAAGGRARFPGIVGTAVTKVFGLEVARTGLSSAEAREAGFKIRTASVHAAARARYLGGQDVLVRLIAESANGRLLGAQMAGPAGVAQRIDVLATALTARMTVEDLAQLDLSYAPPFSTVWDPILIAAQEMLRQLKR